MGDNASMHTAAAPRFKVRTLRKDQPKRILDNYFSAYQRRHRTKLSEPELAKMMTESGYKINQSTINRIRQGKLYPDIETALKFSNYLEVDFLEFIGLEFWAPSNPDSHLTTPAKNIARTFEQLPDQDRDSVERIVSALLKTAKKLDAVK